jgi:hypothetical protein
MTAYTNDVPVQSPLLDIGDDVYAKPIATLSTGGWRDDVVVANPNVGFLTWMLPAASLDYANAYIIFKNLSNVAFTNTGNVITSTSHGLTDSSRLYFKGASIPSNLVIGQPYYVKSLDANTFSISATSGGAVLTLDSDGSGTYIAVENQSSSDQELGPLPADEAVLVGEGQASRADAQFADILARLVTVQSKTDLIGTLRSLIRW